MVLPTSLPLASTARDHCAAHSSCLCRHELHLLCHCSVEKPAHCCINSLLQAVHELQKGNVPVAVASDNVRDQFYVYGDLDMLEVFAQARSCCIQLLGILTSWLMASDMACIHASRLHSVYAAHTWCCKVAVACQQPANLAPV